MLKGTIYITDREDIVYTADMSNTKIINLDEDGILMDNPGIIGGTCLLPPIDAKIAEADGNEILYDTIYSNHLLDNYQRQFIAALIAYLYKGGNLIIFLPEIGCTNTQSKLMFHFYQLYGIHIGLIGSLDPSVSNFYYDKSCIPLWLNLLYEYDVISGREYLYMYPLDADIISNKYTLSKLIEEFNPYATNIREAINSITRLMYSIHKKPNVEIPLVNSIRRDF